MVTYEALFMYKERHNSAEKTLISTKKLQYSCHLEAAKLCGGGGTEARGTKSAGCSQRSDEIFEKIEGDWKRLLRETFWIHLLKTEFVMA